MHRRPLLFVSAPVVIFWMVNAFAQTMDPATTTQVVVNPWVDLATRFGLPTAILVGLSLYHVRVVAQKDAAIASLNKAWLDDHTRISAERAAETKTWQVEFSRVNDLRVQDAQSNATKLLEQNQRFMDLLGDVESTMKVLGERVK